MMKVVASPLLARLRRNSRPALSVPSNESTKVDGLRGNKAVDLCADELIYNSSTFSLWGLSKFIFLYLLLAFINSIPALVQIKEFQSK